jgi:hypothetical protein
MTDSDRTEKLLALLLLHNMKGASKSDKALQLNLAGFSNIEIANLLQTSPAVIAQLLYTARRSSGSRSHTRNV